MYHWAVGRFVGWWLIGGGGVLRVWHGEGALSVQNLMCDGCRGVAVGGEPGRMLGGAWRGCRLVAGLQRGFVFR